MNLLERLRGVLHTEHRAVAVIKAPKGTGMWSGETGSKTPVVLYGHGYAVGQTVFYDAKDGRIIEPAPDLKVVDIRV